MSGASRGESKLLRGVGSGSMPLLSVMHASAGFDAEQIWMQLELAADASLKRVRKLVAKVHAGSDGQGKGMSLIKPEYEADISALLDGVVDSSEEEEGEGDEDEDIEGDAGVLHVLAPMLDLGGQGRPTG